MKEPQDIEKCRNPKPVAKPSNLIDDDISKVNLRLIRLVLDFGVKIFSLGFHVGDDQRVNEVKRGTHGGKDEQFGSDSWHLKLTRPRQAELLDGDTFRGS